MTTYSFIDTNVTLVCPDAVIDMGYGNGIGDGGIKYAMANDKNTMTIGADGEGMHSLHADSSGQITIQCLKTSPLNAKLNDLYNLQSLNPRKWGKITITMNHSTSGDNATASKCAFKKKPDQTYAKDGDMIDWVFDAIKIRGKLGRYE